MKRKRYNRFSLISSFVIALGCGYSYTTQLQLKDYNRPTEKIEFKEKKTEPKPRHTASKNQGHTEPSANKKEEEIQIQAVEEVSHKEPLQSQIEQENFTRRRKPNNAGRWNMACSIHKHLWAPTAPADGSVAQWADGLETAQ